MGYIYLVEKGKEENNMIRGIYLWNGDDLTDAFKIRKQVFQKEQQMKEENVFDFLDETSVHVVLYDENEKAVASGRISHIQEEYRIGKIAVLKEERGNKYGDFLVRMLVDKGYLAGASTIKVHAQLHAVSFYKKIGFKNCGVVFIDIDGLEVQPMELVRGELCKECTNCNECNNSKNKNCNI